MAFKRKTYKGMFVDTDECFVCDTASDIQNLPTDCQQGSTAFVIEDSTMYMINSQGSWIQIESTGAVWPVMTSGNNHG